MRKPIKITAEDNRHKGFLRVDAVTYHLVNPDGSTEPSQTREVMRRGDSAAILLLNEDQQAVVLVRQPRIAAWREDSPRDAWLLELPAGVIEQKPAAAPTAETALECARREAEEETGYVVGRCDRIATILPSPGGSSERIHIYFASVTNADRKGTRKPDPDEVIEVVHMRLADVHSLIADGSEIDAKLLVAVQWLQGRSKASDKVLDSGGRRFRFASDTGKNPRIIGYKQGSVDEIHGVDAWVNAENTDMQMARFFDRGVSASIRYLGAARGSDGAIYEDTIANELRRAVSGQVFVRPGSVLVTGSGSLFASHDVKKIFHVACVQHQRNGGVYTDMNAGADGLRRALTMAEELNHSFWHWVRHFRRQPIRSMLVPLIGAGNGGADPEDVARLLIRETIKQLQSSPSAKLREVYFIAFLESHRRILDDLLESGEFGVDLVAIDPVAAGKPQLPKQSGQSGGAVGPGARPTAASAPSARPDPKPPAGQPA